RNNSLRTIVRLLGVRSATTPTGSWNTRSPIQKATSTRVKSKSDDSWPRIHSAQNGIQIANDEAVWYAEKRGRRVRNSAEARGLVARERPISLLRCARSGERLGKRSGASMGG